MSEERPTSESHSSERSAERDSQLSAMFDGELPGAECELLARRLVRDEALRAQWSRYSLIGAAVRAERGVALHDGVARRVQSAIAQEAAYGDSAAVDAVAGNATRAVASASGRSSGLASQWVRLARPVFGAGIAAGVATLSILWLRTQDQPDQTMLASNPVPAISAVQPTAAPVPGSNTLAVNSKPASARLERGNGEPGVYSTPAPSSQTTMAPPARLANYVVAHSEYSGPLSRRLALLSLVGNEGAVDAAPAEEVADKKNKEAAGNGR